MPNLPNAPDGWLYHDQEQGSQFAPKHPVETGLCPKAEDIRPFTIESAKEELLKTWSQNKFSKDAAEAGVAANRKLGAALRALAALYVDPIATDLDLLSALRQTISALLIIAVLAGIFALILTVGLMVTPATVVR